MNTTFLRRLLLALVLVVFGITWSELGDRFMAEVSLRVNVPIHVEAIRSGMDSVRSDYLNEVQASD